MASGISRLSLIKFPSGGGGTTNADNGLSLSAGFVVLGQDVGQSGNPAQLLSNREIPLNGFDITYTGNNGNYIIHSDSSLIQGGLNSGDAYEIWAGIPHNYGTVYPSYGVADEFQTGWQFFAVNPSGRPNVVGTMWGYNGTLGAGRNNSGEAAFQFRTETHFEDIGSGVPYQFEFHLPEFTDQSGTRHRLFSFYVDKQAIHVPSPILEGGGIAFTTWNNPTDVWCFLSANGGEMRLLNNVAGTSNFPRITLGSLESPVNGLTYPNSNWDFSIIHQVSDIIIGRPSLGFSDGASINFSDRVNIGGPSAAASRVLISNGFTILQNYIPGLRPLDVVQNDSGSSQIANFVDGVSGTEVMQVNKTNVIISDNKQLRVGSSAAPTAKVDIAPGTAAAGDGQLKLGVDSALKTTPETGLFEFDGTNLYFTVGGVRKTFTLV